MKVPVANAPATLSSCAVTFTISNSLPLVTVLPGVMVPAASMVLPWLAPSNFHFTVRPAGSIFTVAVAVLAPSNQVSPGVTLTLLNLTWATSRLTLCFLSVDDVASTFTMPPCAPATSVALSLALSARLAPSAGRPRLHTAFSPAGVTPTVSAAFSLRSAAISFGAAFRSLTVTCCVSFTFPVVAAFGSFWSSALTSIHLNPAPAGSGGPALKTPPASMVAPKLGPGSDHLMARPAGAARTLPVAVDLESAGMLAGANFIRSSFTCGMVVVAEDFRSCASAFTLTVPPV